MSHLQASPMSLHRAHPASRKALLAPNKGFLHCATHRRPLLRLKVMLPGHSMWSFEEQDDPYSSCSYSAATPDTVSIAQLPLSQQSLNLAFHMLDTDKDGLLSAAEAYKMVAFYLALQDHKPPAAAASARALSWDQHLHASIVSARKLAGSRWSAMGETLESFVAAKMAGGLQKNPPRCSDIVWAGLGMGLTMLVLGMLVSAAKTWPVVGLWHQQGLPLLLGSFGTFAILLFGKPEAEAVRLWPLVAGQLGATAIAVGVIKVWGAGLMSRAAAMAATVMYMMWTDTIHPPGGALVLMAMSDATIQQFGWLYMLWPSLLLCLAVMLPISVATNWLRRTRQFDWPGQATSVAASLHKKQQEWDQQQQRRDLLLQRSGSIVLSDRIVLPRKVPMSSRFVRALQKMLNSQMLHQTLKQQLLEQRLLQELETQQQQQQQQQQQPPQQQHMAESFQEDIHALRQHMFTPQPRSPESSSGGTPPPDNHPSQDPKPEQQQQQQQQQERPVSPASGFISSKIPSTAPELNDAVRRRLRREADRKLEDEQHREAIWGPALPGLRALEHKLQRLHEQRLRQQHRQKQQGQQPEQPKQQQQLSARGVWETDVNEVLIPTGGEFNSGSSNQHQQRIPSPQQGMYSTGRPAWMYRWRSDISTKPGVGDWDEFAPDGDY